MPNPAAREFAREEARRPPSLVGALVGLTVFVAVGGTLLGCHSEPEIRVYTIPTEVPPELLPEKQRMLAAMVPVDDQVWFFKILGPQSPVTSVEDDFTNFVRTMSYDGGLPDLSQLPDGWKRGAAKPFRYATVDIDTENKQLDLSISKLSAGDDWDSYVASNVNRWRGQVGLSPSQDKWAGGEAFEFDAADATGIWVDLVGEPGAGGNSMTPPFAGMMPGPETPAGPADPHANLPAETRERIASGDPDAARAKPLGEMADGQDAGAATPDTAPTDSPVQYTRPDGWREGQRNAFRLASFDVGEGDSQASVTVITAGGDRRANVARWLGQALGRAPEDAEVDEVMNAAEDVEVDDMTGKRFLLTGDDDDGVAIDAVMLPMENDFSMFIKMTGPKPTVMQERDAMSSFLDSLTFDL